MAATDGVSNAADTPPVYTTNADWNREEKAVAANRTLASTPPTLAEDTLSPDSIASDHTPPVPRLTNFAAVVSAAQKAAQQPHHPLHPDNAYEFQQLAAAEERRKGSASAGAASAIIRALILKPLYLWHKSPLKLFKPVRVDYLVMAKALAPPVTAKPSASLGNGRGRGTPRQLLQARWRASTFGLLSNAVRQEGWSFLPRHVLPPLFANGACGAVLFTTYEMLEPPLRARWTSSDPNCVPLAAYATAGAVAGALHAVVATPLDALQVRLEVRDFLTGRYAGFLEFAQCTARELGAGGLYRGFLFTAAKDTFGYAAFFSAFEGTKALLRRRQQHTREGSTNEDAWLGAAAVLTAGAVAGAAYQLIDHPLDRIRGAVLLQGGERAHGGLYGATWHRCRRLAIHAGGWRAWLYQGLGSNLLKVVPATSLGLFCYELLKRRFKALAEFELEQQQYDY